LVSLAKVGRGRALIGLGKFAEAATAVQGVPLDFNYDVKYNTVMITNGPPANNLGRAPGFVRVADTEGGNGLVWSTDPRAAVTTAPTLTSGMPIPGKYLFSTTGVLTPATSRFDSPIRLASG